VKYPYPDSLNIRENAGHLLITGSTGNALMAGSTGHLLIAGNVFVLLQVSWQVIVLGDDFAATYDCGSTLLGVEYCVHFVSRSPTLDQDTLEAMKTYALDLGLNPLDLDYDSINQDNCW
jgi:hypothetical protein